MPFLDAVTSGRFWAHQVQLFTSYVFLGACDKLSKLQFTHMYVGVNTINMRNNKHQGLVQTGSGTEAADECGC